MAKQGMKRMERTHTQPRNEAAAVPEIQGKAKHGNEKANPVISGTKAPSLTSPALIVQMPEHRNPKDTLFSPFGNNFSKKYTV